MERIGGMLPEVEEDVAEREMGGSGGSEGRVRPRCFFFYYASLHFFYAES